MFSSGQQSWSFLALALGGAVADPSSSITLEAFLTNPAGTWRNKHSGLMAIASTAEGCAQDFEDHLNDFAIIWPCFNGSGHPRVQYAACHALGQLCTDFLVVFRRNCSWCPFRLPPCSKIQVARVQCHASRLLLTSPRIVNLKLLHPSWRYFEHFGINLLLLLPRLLEGTIDRYDWCLSFRSRQSRFANFFDRLLPLLVADWRLSIPQSSMSRSWSSQSCSSCC